MIQFICFFSPAFLAADLFEIIQSNSRNFKRFSTIYIIFVGTINSLCLGIIALIFHHPNYTINLELFNIGFAFKYLLLSLSLAIVLPNVFEKTRKVSVKFWRILKERRNVKK